MYNSDDTHLMIHLEYKCKMDLKWRKLLKVFPTKGFIYISVKDNNTLYDAGTYALWPLIYISLV